MKQLIKNQNIKFDTHQAGDGQETNLKGLHLEKILHKPKNTKIKFHFFEKIPIEKQNNNIDKKLFKKIQSEVSKALNRNPQKTNELGELILKTLYRYKTQGIDEIDALEAVKNIADYFDLNEDFIRKTIKYGKDNKIIEVTTTHPSNDTSQKRHNIKQTKNDISISSRRSK
ncbi:MAG: hypothetical protein Q9M36_13380 [Sulfurovum sp.]|nr:hypothetical protein [Sulfurovum sp.]